MKKSILLLAILLVLSMASCNTQQQEYYEKNPTEAPSIPTLDPNWTPMPAPTNEKGEVIVENPYDYLNPERIFNPGEWMDIWGVEFRFNGVEFTKNGHGINLEKIGVFNPNYSGDGIPVDKAGNLYGNKSYTILDYTVKNTTDEVLEINLYNIGLFVCHGDEQYRVTAGTGYVEPSPNGNAVYTFQPQEEVDFKSAFILEDHYQDDENIFFYVESLIVSTVPVNEPYRWYYFDACVPINKDKSEVDIYTKYIDERDFINPNRIYNIDETVQLKGITFHVDGVTLEKELTGISPNAMRYTDYQREFLNRDGTFSKENWRYLVVELTIQNQTDAEIELCTSAIYLCSPSVDGITFTGPRGVTPTLTENNMYGDFYLFQPREEVTFHLYYTVSDAVFTNATRLFQFPINMGLQDMENPEFFYENDVFMAINKDKNEVEVHA